LGNRLKEAVATIILLLYLASLFHVAVLEVEAAVNSRVFTSQSSDGYIWSGWEASYTIAQNTSSGSVDDTGANYNVGQRYDAGNGYYVSRGFLFFDTSTIPTGATVTNATLSIRIVYDNSATDFNLTIQNGQPTYPHQPLQPGDFGRTHYSGDGGSLNTSTTSVSAYNNITIIAGALTWIQTDGTTKLCLRSSRDISATTPTDQENIGFNGAESGYAAKLYVTYETGQYSYFLYGAYNEEGSRTGAINCTVYRATEPPQSFELDGVENVTSEDIPIAFYFDIGYNESRVYYMKDTFEEIYVIKPSDPYYTYYIALVDFVGVSDAYLESIININGTDRVVERWKIDVVNELPFTFSWGRAYKLRLVCNKGTYYYPDFVAGASFSTTLAITADMFPTAISAGEISLSVQRRNESWIQSVYADDGEETQWIYMAIYAYGESSPTYATNQTTHTLTLNWYGADSDTDYYVLVQAYHGIRGLLAWTFQAVLITDAENPFNALTMLGEFPFDPDQLLGVFIVLCFFGVFSQVNAGVGIFIGVVVAAILTLIGLLSLGWTWLSTSMAVAVTVALSIHKDRESHIQ
jgi:hypothetical protein